MYPDTVPDRLKLSKALYYVQYECTLSAIKRLSYFNLLQTDIFYFIALSSDGGRAKKRLDMNQDAKAETDKAKASSHKGLLPRQRSAQLQACSCASAMVGSHRNAEADAADRLQIPTTTLTPTFPKRVMASRADKSESSSPGRTDRAVTSQ
jgi:hypothetical protein